MKVFFVLNIRTVVNWTQFHASVGMITENSKL